jgi:hypothetical protein
MGIMQGVGRPHMTRKVLTPFQGDESEGPTGSDATSGSDTEAPSPTQGVINKEGIGDDIKCDREMVLARRLARRCHAACYVEIPWCESERALAMLTQWIARRTMEWTR